LVPLAQELEAHLAAKNRLGWVSEECRILSNVRPPASDGGPFFLNCKGAGRLTTRSLGVLEELLKLRMQIAQAKDRPLFKIFSHGTLLALAEAKPASLGGLERTGALSPLQIDRYGHDLLAAVKRANYLPETQLPRYPYQKPKMVPAVVSNRIRTLKRWRETQAQRLKIEPSLICSKIAMNAIAERNPSKMEDLAGVVELRQWQRKSFGKYILAALHKER
jgi:ribonuclease D